MDGNGSVSEVAVKPKELEHMLTMQPQSLKAAGPNSEGYQQYIVTFENAVPTTEYLFIVDDSDIPLVRVPKEYTDATCQDPFAPSLYKSILHFHDSRKTLA